MINLTTMSPIPDTELQVMQTVWRLDGDVTVGQIFEELNKLRSWNYSAIQTLLSRLMLRGYVESYKKDRNRYYKAIIKEEDYLAYANRTFLDRMNRSSLTHFVASLHESNGINEDDLNELQRYLDEAKKK